MSSARDYCPGCNETGWACTCRKPATNPMKHSEELLACPGGCGGQDIYLLRNANGWWQYSCSCGWSGPLVQTRAETTPAWNTRSDTALTEALARVKLTREALTTAEAEARRFAGCYPASSDGRNTFVIMADKIAALKGTDA